MNGQQLTNSSNSANVTPSSSYPASLSSQSSRDGSPAPRPGTLRKPLPEQSYNWPPVSNPMQAKTEGQGIQPATTQPVGGTSVPSRPSPSSQLANNRSPAPVSQSNHLPASNNSYNQFSAPTMPSYPQAPQSSESLRSTQSQTQSPSNQFQSQPPFTNQFSQPNQFQKPYSNVPQANQYQKTHGEQNQLSQPPGQISYPPNQVSNPPSQFPHPPTSLVSQPPSQVFHNPSQVSHPSSQISQPPSQVPHPPSQVSHPPSQVSQPSSQVSHPPSLNSQPPNRFPQSPSQLNKHQNQPLQSQFKQPQNQILQGQNQTQSPHSQFQPVQNKFSQPQNQNLPLHNQLLPSQNQILPPSNRFPPPQNQLSQPQNQFGQPSPAYNSLKQTSQPPNPVPQMPNHFSQVPGQVVNQQPQLHSQPYPAQQLPPPSANQFNKRYPQMNMQPSYPPCAMDGLNSQMAGMTTVQQGFNKMWGMDSIDLLKCRDLVPQEKVEPPAVRLQHELYESANCSPEIFRCTLTKIPETKSLLDKSRLPLGVLIHPFKDLNQLSVIQCTVIVRCRMCRTYINPFVYFVDNKRWKCNLCFRVNELPDEFQFDPMTKTYGDPSRRPEIKSATIEFIAPSEYMVRPPQPAVYVFVLDVSRLACDCGYLDAVCRTLLAELDNVPGDARTSVAFITFDSAVHFYSLADGQAQPHQLTVVDIDDMFLPTPENLLVSLSESRELIRDLLHQLPQKFQESYDTQSALGAALQAAYKLLSPTGGRVTVFQASLPNAGPGALTAREDPSQRAGDNPPHLNPSTDFYKKLALDCSGQQIAVDLFLVNSQYIDLATISGVSRFSGGCMHHVPLYRSDKPLLMDSLERMFQRYLTRKIGFESVMRLRCTRGLSIHTFHGNFFVRSTDLLSLPNANPDAGFGMQVTIDENLSEVQTVCFQAALLYTSSKGERRIRVHTLCLPIASNLADVMHSADQQCIAGLLAKMAVDRAVQSSLSDAREAFVNVVADVLSAYKLTQSSNTAGCLLAPFNLRLLPLYILALLKHVAFRVGQSTRLDDRVFAMCQMKSLPLTFLMQSIYPDLYSVTDIENHQKIIEGEDMTVPQPPRLQLSSERVDSHGLYLMDDGSSLLLYVGHNLSPNVCRAVFQVNHFSAIPHDLLSLPELDNPTSTALRTFINYLLNEKPFPPSVQIIRDDSPNRMRFIERLVEDKNESGISYYEFIQQVKSITK